MYNATNHTASEGFWWAQPPSSLGLGTSSHVTPFANTDPIDGDLPTGEDTETLFSPGGAAIISQCMVPSSVGRICQICREAIMYIPPSYRDPPD